jgi:hypothetical protein
MENAVEGAPLFDVKIEFRSDGQCQFLNGRNVWARNTNVRKTVRATIQQTSRLHPRQIVVTTPPGGQEQIGCEKELDQTPISYQVVGEE